MATPEQVKAAIAKLAAAKHDRRHRLAALPYPEKVRAVVQLQRMTVPILKDRDKRACVWEIDTRE
jgi:hypothetical protein